MTPPPNLPAGYEEVTAPFLREHGAVEGMLWITKGASIECWSNYAEEIGFEKPEHQKVALTCGDYDFCAPTGTIAAVTTPLPEPRCDCGNEALKDRAAGSGDCLPSCSIHLRYYHVLPGELAKMPTKPEGLIWRVSKPWCDENNGRSEWSECPLIWPYNAPSEDGRLFVFALPLRPDKEELPNAECPHCSGWNHVSKIYCHNCGGKLPAHPDLAPPQPEKGKGGEVDAWCHKCGWRGQHSETGTMGMMKDLCPRCSEAGYAIRTKDEPIAHTSADAATHALPDEEIRIGIAEWCGWRRVKVYEWTQEGSNPAVRVPLQYSDPKDLPAYTTSLDAIASAEARLTDTQHNAYRLQIIHTLAEDQGVPWSDIYGNGRVWFSAPPRIRAHALLLTINPKLP